MGDLMICPAGGSSEASDGASAVVSTGAAASGAAGVAVGAATRVAVVPWRLMRTEASPSCISSSVTSDSLTNSINFLILRMSIALKRPVVLEYVGFDDD